MERVAEPEEMIKHPHEVSIRDEPPRLQADHIRANTGTGELTSAILGLDDLVTTELDAMGQLLNLLLGEAKASL